MICDGFQILVYIYLHLWCKLYCLGLLNFRFLAFSFTHLISIDVIPLCSGVQLLRWSTITAEIVDLIFCIIFLRLRQYVRIYYEFAWT